MKVQYSSEKESHVSLDVKWSGASMITMSHVAQMHEAGYRRLWWMCRSGASETTVTL